MEIISDVPTGECTQYQQHVGNGRVDPILIQIIIQYQSDIVFLNIYTSTQFQCLLPVIIIRIDL